MQDKLQDSYLSVGKGDSELSTGALRALKGEREIWEEVLSVSSVDLFPAVSGQ